VVNNEQRGAVLLHQFQKFFVSIQYLLHLMVLSEENVSCCKFFHEGFQLLDFFVVFKI
jgi:hypothetical protein